MMCVLFVVLLSVLARHGWLLDRFGRRLDQIPDNLIWTVREWCRTSPELSRLVPKLYEMSSNVTEWAEMGLNDTILRMISNGRNGPKWCRVIWMLPSATGWSRVVQNGPEWTWMDGCSRMARLVGPKRPEWAQMAWMAAIGNGWVEWIRTDQNGWEGVETRRIARRRSEVVSNGPKRPRVQQSRFKMALIVAGFSRTNDPEWSQMLVNGPRMIMNGSRLPKNGLETAQELSGMARWMV